MSCRALHRSARAAAVLLYLLLIAAGTQSISAGSVPTEYEVKAAFLCNFARFVRWPAGALPDTAALIIGVMGADPFGRTLDEAVAGQTVLGHTFRIRRSSRLADLAGSHILFVSSSENDHLEKVLHELDRSATLTIGDEEDSTTRGCVIGFTMEENKVRFAINQDAANRAGLELSAKLMALALNRRGTGP